MDLHDCCESVMKRMAEDAKAKQGPNCKQSALSFVQRTRTGIELRAATTRVQHKYVELEKALGAYQPYYPLSLTFFEPTNGSDRYIWLQSLQLSFPIGLLKIPVGGTLGVLVWVMRRDDGSAADDEAQLLEDARSLIQPLIPEVCAHYLVWM